MDYEKIKNKLTQYDQMQLLRFYDELNDDEKEVLLKEIDNIDFDLISLNQSDGNKGEISPIEALTLDKISERKNEFSETGVEAMRQGKVACVLLAGGQGTRLGFDGPKGTLNVGLTKQLYLFQCLIQNLFDVKNQVGQWMRNGECADCQYWKYCHGNGLHLRDDDGKLIQCNLKKLSI